MATTRAKKAEILSELTEEFKTAGAAVFHSYIGLTVGDITSLRRALHDKGVKMVVAKKTLMRLAAKNAGLKDIPEEALTDAVAISFAHGDELAAAQEVYAFGKEHEQVKILGGMFEGEMMGTAQAMQLATLPGRQALLGQLVSVMVGPIRGFAGVGHQVIASAVRALSEIEKQKAAA